MLGRRSFGRHHALACAGLVALLGVAGCVKPSTEKGLAELRQARRAAAHHPRRIIINHDGCYYDGKPQNADEPRTAENFLKKGVTALAVPKRSQVDAVFYCTGVFDLYSHRSRESEFKTSGSNRWDWAYELAQGDQDDLQIVTDFCHEHGMEAFWSMRMNDTHDSAPHAELGLWKRAHPDCLMGTPGDKFPHGAGRWSAVNYGQVEVRDKVFRILQDVCTTHSVDGVELDFFRHPILFKPQMTGEPVTLEQCNLMTDLLRRIRRMTEDVGLRRGRPLLLSVRVPDSEGFCRALGLDVSRWMQEDLIDLLVVSGYFRLNSWKTSVAWGHRYGVPVYASLDESRLAEPFKAMRRRLPESYRGRALQAWSEGVDGIYTFNLQKPALPLYWEMGDPALLERLDKFYSTGDRPLRPNYYLKDGKLFATQPEDPLPEHPRLLKPGQSTTVELEVPDRLASGSEDGEKPRGEVWLAMTDPVDPAQVAVRCNGIAAGKGTLRKEKKIPQDWLVYPLNAGTLVTGTNRLEVTLGTDAAGPVKLQDALLWLRYSPPTPGS